MIIALIIITIIGVLGLSYFINEPSYTSLEGTTPVEDFINLMKRIFKNGK